MEININEETNIEDRGINQIDDSNWYSEMCCLFCLIICCFFMEIISMYFPGPGTYFCIIRCISYTLIIISIIIKNSCLYKSGYYIYLIIEIICIIKVFFKILIPLFMGKSSESLDEKDNKLIKENELVKYTTIVALLLIITIQIYIICYLHQKINIFISYEKYKRKKYNRNNN